MAANDFIRLAPLHYLNATSIRLIRFNMDGSGSLSEVTFELVNGLNAVVVKAPHAQRAYDNWKHWAIDREAPVVPVPNEIVDRIKNRGVKKA
jgi:hypothetical protein